MNYPVVLEGDRVTLDMIALMIAPKQPGRATIQGYRWMGGVRLCRVLGVFPQRLLGLAQADTLTPSARRPAAHGTDQRDSLGQSGNLWGATRSCRVARDRGMLRTQAGCAPDAASAPGAIADVRSRRRGPAPLSSQCPIWRSASLSPMRRTGSGSPTSPMSRPRKGSCIWPSSSMCSVGAWAAGRWPTICPQNSS